MPLVFHFLNVGQGDCTIIQFPSGRVAMVDIDNLKVLDPDTRKEILEEYHESVGYLTKSLSLSRIIENKSTDDLDEEYLKEYREKLTDPLAYYDTVIGAQTDIFRMIITHLDMDHMTGLHRIHEQDSRKSIGNFWHVGNYDFNLESVAEGWYRYDKLDWKTYKALRASPENPKSLVMRQRSQNDFWTQDGIEIWAPTPDLVKDAVDKGKSNIISMVLKISYAGRTVVLGGDATSEEVWSEIMKTIPVGHVDVLKASHHGRRSGYYMPAVKAMSPWLTITSVGEVEHDATPNYRRYSDNTVSLRKSGDIRITIADDGKWYYWPDLAPYWKNKTA